MRHYLHSSSWLFLAWASIAIFTDLLILTVMIVNCKNHRLAWIFSLYIVVLFPFHQFLFNCLLEMDSDFSSFKLGDFKMLKKSNFAFTFFDFTVPAKESNEIINNLLALPSTLIIIPFLFLLCAFTLKLEASNKSRRAINLIPSSATRNFA